MTNNLPKVFDTEQKCRAYIHDLRWPNGFVCPTCPGKEYWPLSSGHLRCASCRSKFSTTAGTMFHRIKLPLKLWFEIIWSVTHQGDLANAKDIKKRFALGSYETAFNKLHKIRLAMAHVMNQFLLSGEIQCWKQDIIIGRERAGITNRRLTLGILAKEDFYEFKLCHIASNDDCDMSLLTFMCNSTAPMSEVDMLDHKRIDSNSYLNKLVAGYITRSPRHTSDKYFHYYTNFF